jgi:CRP-like cAMP-binding protein
VRSNLTPAVMDFFAPAKGYSERLECPELAAQMARLMQRREAQSRAAELTNAQRNANRSGKETLSVAVRGTLLRRAKPRRTKPRKAPSGRRMKYNNIQGRETAARPMLNS